MYFDEKDLETELSKTHRKITRKPWNVRPNDIIVLEQYGMGYGNNGFMPVEITAIDSYPEIRRSDTSFTKYTKVSHKTHRFYHRPINPSDARRLAHWNSSQWFTFDEVELWRPTNTQTEQN